MARLGEIYLTGMAAPDTATPAALLRLEESPGEASLLKRLYPHGLSVRQDPGAGRALEFPRGAGRGSRRRRRASAINMRAGSVWSATSARLSAGLRPPRSRTTSPGQLGLGMLYARRLRRAPRACARARVARAVRGTRQFDGPAVPGHAAAVRRGRAARCCACGGAARTGRLRRPTGRDVPSG